MKEPEQYTYQTNIKEGHLVDIVSNFIKRQIGAGADHKPPEIRDIYHIRLEIDLTYDIFYCKHDCGNLGLRDGILVDILGRLSK
jgi:hypothetical protein